MQKNETKSAQRKLGAASNGGSRKLLVEVLILGKNGVKMASSFPFLCFFDSHARPGELATRPGELIYFFLQKFFAKLCYSLFLS